MHYKYIKISILLFLATGLQAQTSLDNLFESVLKNNQTIKAYGLYSNWQKQVTKVGNTPNNPEVEYGYFPGNSDAIGTKTVFSVSQSFKFPTTYIYKNKLAHKTAEIADIEFRLNSQEILLKTWQCWAKAIYFNKMSSILKQRQADAQKMLNNYLKKQLNGDATQLEVNKARLFLIAVENKVRMQKGLANQNLEELSFLNGRIPLAINDTAFGYTPLISWDSLVVRINDLHPEIFLAKTNKQLADNKLQLSKSNWFPAFSLGYESEDIMGDKYSGIKGGITIPLWQDKGAVSSSKANVVFNEQMVENTELQTLIKYKQKYDRLLVLGENLNAFNNNLSEMNNEYLLARSLELGQIPAIEYFMELNYFYEISDELINLELEYQLHFAELFDFTLM